jgi:hypothetical protein
MSKSNTAAKSASRKASKEFRLRRHGPNTEYAPGYIHTGAVIPQVEISKILQRLDEAFYVARGIDARQRKLEGGQNGRRSPVLRLAGRIRGIFKTLDKVHGHAEYVHDIRLPHIAVLQYRHRLETPATKIASQAADAASRGAAPAVLKQEVAHGQIN